MSTTNGDARISRNRYEELTERLTRLEARVELVEQREDAGVALAEELGGAALRTLKRRTRKPAPQTRGL